MEELILQLLIDREVVVPQQRAWVGRVGAMKWEGTTFKTKDLRVPRSE